MRSAADQSSRAFLGDGEDLALGVFLFLNTLSLLEAWGSQEPSPITDLGTHACARVFLTPPAGISRIDHPSHNQTFQPNTFEKRINRTATAHVVTNNLRHANFIRELINNIYSVSISRNERNMCILTSFAHCETCLLTNCQCYFTTCTISSLRLLWEVDCSQPQDPV